MREHVEAVARARGLRDRLEAFLLEEDAAESLAAAAEGWLTEEVPAYAGISAVDLARAPFVGKEDLRARGHEFVRRDVERLGPLWARHTSGTTGPPVPILLDADSYFDLLHLSLRKIAAMAGAEAIRPVLAVAVADNPAAPQFVLSDPLEESGITVQLVIDERHTDTVERAWQTITWLEPAILATKPTLLEVLCDASPPALSSPPELVISSGAALEQHVREAAEATIGAPVVDAYGTTEHGLVAIECPARRGMHLDRSAVVAEIEEGELVLSSARNKAMPLVRYRTGDLVTLDDDPCPCGRTSARIVQLSGRRMRCFRLSSGRTVSPARFNSLFARFPLRELQITQVESDSFEALFDLREDVPANQTEWLLDELEREVRGTFPAPVHVHARAAEIATSPSFERYRALG